MREILEESGIDPEAIDEVILGQVITGGSGQNQSRQIFVEAGLPIGVPALTMNKVCGSGLKAVALAANAIRAGEANAIIAGGQENIHQLKHYYLLT